MNPSNRERASEDLAEAAACPNLTSMSHFRPPNVACAAQDRAIHNQLQKKVTRRVSEGYWQCGTSGHSSLAYALGCHILFPPSLTRRATTSNLFQRGFFGKRVYPPLSNPK